MLKKICAFIECPLFSNQRSTLPSIINDINDCFTNNDDLNLVHILLNFFRYTSEILVLEATINCIISTSEFEENLAAATFCSMFVYTKFIKKFEQFVIFLCFKGTVDSVNTHLIKPSLPTQENKDFFLYNNLH